MEANTSNATGARPKETVSFKCNKCDFVTKQQRILTGHMTAHGNQEFPVYHCCNQCDHSFKTVGLLKRHVRQMHENTEPERPQAENNSRREILIKCDDCSYKSNSTQDLMRHKDAQHVQKKTEGYRTCRYWLRGACVFGVNCRFEHLLPNQGDAYMNNQNYMMECWFQQNCLNQRCLFQHNSNHFLENSSPDLNSYQEFPPFPHWTQHY